MRRQHLVLIALVVAVVAAALGIFGWKFAERHRNLDFTLVFDNAKNVHEGQFVVYNGVRIGTVTEVRLRENDNKAAVSVSIDAEHRAKVYGEAVFIVESPTLLNVSGEKQVTMKDIGNSRTPIVKGAVVQGTNSVFEEWGRRAKEGLGSLITKKP